MRGSACRASGCSTCCHDRKLTKDSNTLPQRENVNELVTIGELLQNRIDGIDDLDVRWILQSVLKVNAAFLIAHADHVLSLDQTACVQQLLIRRMAGEPVAYLTGERGFYDLVFEVTPDVLIPRPETELLVEVALSKIPSDQYRTVLDLGTGSGAIAITIAKHRSRVHVTAVDLSPCALAVARKNATALSVGNITFIAGNWYSGLGKGKFDVIVANPPYIAEGDPHLERGDLRFEPCMALVAGGNGLNCIHEIVTHAPDYLNQAGWLLLEHGYDQAGACRRLLEKAGFTHIFSLPDLAGIDRVSGGQYGFIPA
jgi:release factor glutamine methyltransferase